MALLVHINITSKVQRPHFKDQGEIFLGAKFPPKSQENLPTSDNPKSITKQATPIAIASPPPIDSSEANFTTLNHAGKSIFDDHCHDDIGAAVAAHAAATEGIKSNIKFSPYLWSWTWHCCQQMDQKICLHGRNCWANSFLSHL